MDDPAKGRSALSTAPAPVEIPQASGPRMETSVSSGTFTRALAAQIEYDANDDWPKKCVGGGAPVKPPQRGRPVGARPGDHQRAQLQAVPRLPVQAVPA